MYYSMQTNRSSRAHESRRMVGGCLAILFIAMCFAGCAKQPSEPQVGPYRATLKLPGGEAPFGLEIVKHESGFALELLNGAERTRVDNVTVESGELFAVFPGYENSLRASIKRDRLTGNVTLIKAGGKEQVIPFEAKHGQTHRFFAEPSSDNADVAGRWAVTFTNDEGETSPAVALFEQEHDRVVGTVMTPTGDHRFLEGQVRGDELRLSTFAGGLAYLYHLRVTDDGRLEGEYWQGLAWHERVSAERNDDATLEGVGPETTLRSDSERLDFTFRDPEGHEVSLSDERFQDKVVLVTIGGTWCPNCHDEARFLVPFYREYQDKGFEIVALMFERHGDFEKAAAAVRGYRRDLEINFPILVAGVAEAYDVSNKLPMLSGVYGYPTAILLDKQGNVRDIHIGFSGPATGKHYEDYVAEFTAKVDALLAE
ncbi:MAG: TlpA family protein disulfide reductase [Xanthomonadaceae bacterium]|nr:TlpA family protein disulfide reductase [Xanthomonadaceae bacterium]